MPVLTARELLYYYRRSSMGIEPGSFNLALIRAMEAADIGNLSRLLLVFPDFHDPVRYLQEHGSVELENRFREDLQRK